MFKKIAIGLGAFAAVAIVPVATFAQGSEIIARPIPYPLPQPPVRQINVTPKHPLDLNSCGKLTISGRGWTRVENFNGGMNLSVKGRLAIKEEDLGSVQITGFNSKQRRGNYIVFWGRGSAAANGQDLDLILLGKGKFESKGCGETHLKGRWQGTFQPFWRVIPLPEPQPLPFPIELHEFEAEALAG